jgi:hypothetical protein
MATMPNEKPDAAPTADTMEYSMEEASPTATAALSSQKTTKQMIFISLYVALAGWIFNFDLGQWNTLQTPR